MQLQIMEPEIKKTGIRIVSDGTPEGTSIIDVASGVQLDAIINAAIHISAEHGVIACLTVLVDSIDVTTPHVILEEEILTNNEDSRGDERRDDSCDNRESGQDT